MFMKVFWQREISVNTIVLVGRWSLKGHSLMTLVKFQLCTYIFQVSEDIALSHCLYSSFNGNMVLKRLCISDTGEPLAVHIHCSVLLGDRGSSQYESFSGNMVLKRAWVVDIQEALAEHSHCSGLPGDRVSS